MPETDKLRLTLTGRHYITPMLMAVSGASRADLAVRRQRGTFRAGGKRGGSASIYYSAQEVIHGCAHQHLIRGGRLLSAEHAGEAAELIGQVAIDAIIGGGGNFRPPAWQPPVYVTAYVVDGTPGSENADARQQVEAFTDADEYLEFLRRPFPIVTVEAVAFGMNVLARLEDFINDEWEGLDLQAAAGAASGQ